MGFGRVICAWEEIYYHDPHCRLDGKVAGCTWVGYLERMLIRELGRCMRWDEGLGLFKYCRNIWDTPK